MKETPPPGNFVWLGAFMHPARVTNEAPACKNEKYWIDLDGLFCPKSGQGAARRSFKVRSLESGKMAATNSRL